MQKVMLLLFLSLIGFSTGASADEKPIMDWSKLFATCGSNWTEYLTKLEDLRAKADRWINGHPAMTEEQFRSLFDADDKLMILITATWPELLQKPTPDRWVEFRDCAADHWKILKDTISNRMLSTEEKKKVVQDWADCVQSKYLMDKIIAPLDGLNKCYLKQAQKLKD